MPTYEPSVKIVHAFLDPETRIALSLPLAALITGALSQVETTIELTNRVCDSIFTIQSKARARTEGNRHVGDLPEGGPA
jgi:hypothetical protein